MKYINANFLRKELQKLKNELKVENYYLDNSEQAVGYENALNDFESLIDSLQQEPSIHTELCTLIACDVIQATAKRAIEKPQDKDKEEDLMIKKMEYLNMLEKSSSQQEQPEVDLEKEIDKEWRECYPIDEGMGYEKAILVIEQFHQIACHFYELGQQSRLKTSDTPQEDLDNLLEEEIENYFNGWCDDDEYGQAVMPDCICASVDDCKDIARHFAEWGAMSKMSEVEDAIRLTWGKVSKNPFDTEEAFAELINKVKSL